MLSYLKGRVLYDNSLGEAIAIMNIGIIDADLLDNGTRHPNLALMKISGYYKEKGHTVSLLDSYEVLEDYDQIYISKVFSYTRVPEGIISLPNVTIGGLAFRG